MRLLVEKEPTVNAINDISGSDARADDDGQSNQEKKDIRHSLISLRDAESSARG